MKNAVVMTMAMLIIAGATVSCATAAGPARSESLTTHYEAIRQALLHDTMKDVTTHAKAMEGMAVDLKKSSLPASQSRNAGEAPAGQSQKEAAARTAEILTSIERSSLALGKAADLKSARQIFGDLSTSLIAYQGVTVKADNMVVYCSMAKKSWLQPKGEIGNPYYGQSMARCGQIVSK